MLVGSGTTFDVSPVELDSPLPDERRLEPAPLAKAFAD
jgi:hypothetical protein